MKPTIESLMQQYNIRPYNGSWYVQESKLKEMLQKIVDGVYDSAYHAGYIDGWQVGDTTLKESE